MQVIKIRSTNGKEIKIAEGGWAIAAPLAHEAIRWIGIATVAHIGLSPGVTKLVEVAGS